MNKLTQRGGGFRSWSFCDKVIINLKCPLSKLSNKKIKSYFRNFDSSNNNKTKDLSVFSQIQLLNIVSASLNHVNLTECRFTISVFKLKRYCMKKLVCFQIHLERYFY